MARYESKADFVGGIRAGCALMMTRLSWLGLGMLCELVASGSNTRPSFNSTNFVAGEGSRNNVRRSSREPRVTCRQYLETVKA